MAEKLREYEGLTGRWHSLRDDLRARRDVWREENPAGFSGWLREKCFPSGENSERDYSHIYRRKTTRELVRISAAVMGVEFSYAAETAFVSPTLLKIGVEHERMTLVWALSPLVGFFLTPVLGSLSDGCRSRWGRRRPFIFFMSLGVVLGLILVPNGENWGYAMGDRRPPDGNYHRISSHRTTARLGAIDFRDNDSVSGALFNETFVYDDDDDDDENLQSLIPYNNSHPWGVLFTILGTVLLDFDADACQSPARAYLLDVTVPEDHARGLSTFTVMAGLGGFLGYALGGINWDVTFIGELLGGHVKAVFTLTTFIFVGCVASTLTSFVETPLDVVEAKRRDGDARSYGSLERRDVDEDTEQYRTFEEAPPGGPEASLGSYLASIVYTPPSIRILCLTNLFCWMAHVCYSLYFTDFVGEAVFNGNPMAMEGSRSRELYESGVRFGCWGMSMYSLSCACYSTKIEKLIGKFGAKKVYVGGLLVYSTGMLLMALTKHKIGVIVFSWTAGVMYSTLFTMPYLIIAHYHAKGTFETTLAGEEKISTQVRGLGTDVALVSSMVFLAQFALSACMGAVVSAAGTTTAVVAVASALAFLGAVAATQVVYLDL